MTVLWENKKVSMNTNEPVLIINDRRSEVWFIERTFQKEGFRTIAAFNGKSGLDKVREEQPGLVILDTTLPDIDGYQVYQSMQKDPATSGIPVLFLSLNRDTDENKLKILLGNNPLSGSGKQTKSRQPAVIEFLSKPAKAQELLTGAQSLFKQRDQYLLPENETRPGPILIIDDNRSLVRLAERALQKDGFNVVTAFSGIDGLRKVKEEKPGLIILDIILPELSGFDILQQVRQQTDVPVIMLTSDNHIDSIKKTMALGADDYLLKPISTVELLTRVHNKLDSSG